MHMSRFYSGFKWCHISFNWHLIVDFFYQIKFLTVHLNIMCRGFRLTKRDDYFGVDFDHF